MLALTLALAGALSNALPRPVAQMSQSAMSQPAMSQLAMSRPVAEVKTHVLIVAGLSGYDSTFQKNFYEYGKRFAETARSKYSVPDSMIIFLAENPQRDAALIRGASTKVNIEQAFATITKRAKPGDLVVVFLIGHGSSQSSASSKFNIPGTPDMGADDFAKLLAPLAKQQVVFVNSTSASGDFIGGLAGKNRLIITSTLSPLERNYSQFAKYFSAVFATDDSDVNRDGRISMLEAFEYTRRKVEQGYKAAKILQSEHALLDDDGDGKGVQLPAIFETDGRLAARVFFTGVAPEDPQLAELLSQYAALRIKVENFVANRDDMEGATYGKQLEGMLIDLAVLGLKVEQAAGKTP